MDTTTKVLHLSNHYLQLKGVKDSLLERIKDLNAEMKAVRDECEALQKAEIEKENEQSIEQAII